VRIFKSFHCFVFSIVFLLLSFALHAQHKNIKIGDAINSWEPEEPSIIINPNNTDHILVGTNGDNYYFSRDGGLNWTHGVLRSSYGVNCDPCVQVDSRGIFYYFHLVPGLSRVVCQKAEELGHNWSNGTYVSNNFTKDCDKEWATIDRDRDLIYLTWAQFDKHGSTNPNDSTVILLSKSTDFGESWDSPKIISNKKGNAMGGNESNHAPMPAVGPNGEVYVTWMSPKGLMFDLSMDYGETWLERDIRISNRKIYWLKFNIPGLQRAPGFPVIDCDRSNSSFRGNIYISWAEQLNGNNDSDVWLVKSSDGGKTWSEQIRVNNDPPGKHQFFSWMTIDQTNGFLYFVFYDRRNQLSTKTDVYMAVSTDGGDTFYNFKISASPFSPNSDVFLGDYIGLSVHNNVIRPVWPRIDGNQLSLWAAIIDPNQIPAIISTDKDIIIRSFQITSVYPNPFNSSTQINFKLEKSGHTKLSIINLIGNEVSTLIDEFKEEGDHSFNFYANELSTGIFFISLQQQNHEAIRKLLLLK
jgi:hypothetical protein